MRPPNAPIRSTGALVLVWALSFALYPLKLTALAVAAWIIATLVLVPIGATLTDRIVALLLLGAAPAVLIAWFTPYLPWLVSPPVLTGLLGSLVALAWGLGWTRRPVTRLPDVVTIAMGALTAGIFWIPFMVGGLARIVGVLSAGFDQSAHYGMWMRVWANHGYLLFNTLPDPDAWIWRTYPQGTQALLADVGSVLTGNSGPPAQVDQSATLFAVLICLQAGALALVSAWSVDRLSRGRKNRRRHRVVIFQIVVALLIAVGPGSVVSIQSLSFTAGLVVIIPSVALAATAARSPRRDGLLIGAAFVAAAAIYPICALMAVAVWPTYLWTSRRYWLASNRRRWYGVLWTVALGLLCAPMFVFLVLRDAEHSWETPGYFEVINGVIYAGITVLLALLIIFARGRVPKTVQYASWIAATVSAVLIVEGLLQWLTIQTPSYYTVKTMYLGWMLSVVALGAGLASIHKRRASAIAPARYPGLRIFGRFAAELLVVGALIAGLMLARLDQNDPSRGWPQSFAKELAVIARASSFQDKYGSLTVATAEYGAAHDGVTVVVRCGGGREYQAVRWAMFLTGGMNSVEQEVLIAACTSTEEAPLGLLPDYLESHPDVRVTALALDRDIYEYTVRQQAAHELSNLEVVPPPVESDGSGW